MGELFTQYNEFASAYSLKLVKTSSSISKVAKLAEVELVYQ